MRLVLLRLVELVLGRGVGVMFLEEGVRVVE